MKNVLMTLLVAGSLVSAANAQYVLSNTPADISVFLTAGEVRGANATNDSGINRNRGIGTDGVNLYHLVETAGGSFPSYIYSVDTTATVPLGAAAYTFYGNLSDASRFEGSSYNEGAFGVGNDTLLAYSERGASGFFDQYVAIENLTGTPAYTVFLDETIDPTLEGGWSDMEYITGTQWLVAEGSGAFGANDTMFIYDSSDDSFTELLVNGANSIDNIAVVFDSANSHYDALAIVDGNTIVRYDDILGGTPPLTGTDITPAAWAGLTFQCIVAIDSDTYLVIDDNGDGAETLTEGLRINDGASQFFISTDTIQTTAAIAAQNVYYRFNGGVHSDGLALTSPDADTLNVFVSLDAWTGTTNASDAAIIQITFDNSVPSSVDGWTLYDF